MAFRGPRWTPINTLPVLFVLSIIFSVYGLYAWEHLLTLLLDPATRERGIWQAVILHIFAIPSCISFVLAVFTDPGSVPQTMEWRREDAGARLRQSLKEEQSEGSGETGERQPTELKQTGARRFCKWCNLYKPDRCHHCRVCRSCILRMDHHCPWIANCVGFRNQKYFFLLVLHSLISCIIVIVTMAETWQRAVEKDVSMMDRFLIVYGLTLAVIMTTLLVPFFLLHCSFMFRAVTTIEHCEKRHKRASSSAFDLGVFSNMKAVFGPYVLLWLLPVCPPEGDGLSFETQVTRGLGAAASSKSAAQQGSPLLSGAEEQQQQQQQQQPQPVVAESAASDKAGEEESAESVAKQQEEVSGSKHGPVSDADAHHTPEVTGSLAQAA